MSNFNFFLLGLTLLVVGLGLHVYAWFDHGRQFAAVSRENTTIDENNPPKIVMQKSPAGGTIFSNEGGLAEHTPTNNFTNYENVIDKIDHGLRWFKRTGTFCALVGLLLVITSTGRYLVGL